MEFDKAHKANLVGQSYDHSCSVERRAMSAVLVDEITLDGVDEWNSGASLHMVLAIENESKHIPNMKKKRMDKSQIIDCDNFQVSSTREMINHYTQCG